MSGAAHLTLDGIPAGADSQSGGRVDMNRGLHWIRVLQHEIIHYSLILQAPEGV